MFFRRGDVAPTATCSSILWMLCVDRRRTRPPAGRCAEMKRPSDVPPVVDSSACTPHLVARSRLRPAPAERARAREEGRAAERPDERVLDAVAAAGSSSTRGFSCSGVDSVEKRKLKSITASPGMTLVAPVPAWMFEIWKLVGGKWSLPRVPLRGRQFGERRRGHVDRVARQVRVGHVALHADTVSLRRQPAAAAVLDRVAERSTQVGSPTMQQSSFSPRACSAVDDAHRAVDGRAFLVAGEQEARCGRRARDARRRTPRRPPPSPPARSSCRRRRGRTAGRRGTSARTARCPLVERAGGHDIGVAGEHERRPRARAACARPTGC